MKKIMLLLFGLHSILSAAQVRYIEEVFSEEEITVIKNIPYNTNIGIFDKNGASLYGSPEGISYHPINLYVDIYLPTSIKGIDTASARPVAIIAHGGRFDRFLLDCYGGKDDLATTDLAKKLVKMGYVVVAPQMRMGYNTYYYYDVERMESTYPRNFYDAYIRQSIDLRNCARFLRKSIAEDGNPYKIHRDKFVLWSTNGGGSAVQYAAYYTSEKDFSGPNAPGFYPDYIPRTTYDSTYFGGFEGLANGYELDGELTNIASKYPNYSGAFQMAVIVGGGTSDTLFVQENEVPGIFFNTKSISFYEEPFKYEACPVDGCYYGISSSFFHARKMDELGNNDIWKNIVFDNPITNQRLIYPFDATIGPIEGLFGFDKLGEYQPPWIYWDSTKCAQINESANRINKAKYPNSSIQKGRATMETMVQYFAPRACMVLGLNCGNLTTTIQDIVPTIPFKIMPNPSNGNLTVQSAKENPMQALQIFDSIGKLVWTTKLQGKDNLTVNVNLIKGIYFVKIQFEKGIGSQKLIIQN